MLPIQYILLTLIVILILRVIVSLQKGKIHYMDFFLWLLFWGIVAAIVVLPNITQKAAELVGIGRGADLVVYIGLFGAFAAIYALIIKVRKLEMDITTLGRAIALSNAKDLTKKDEVGKN